MKAKVCLVGPQGVGKTSITTKIDGATGLSRLDAKTTFANVDVLVGETSISLQISDISGEEKLRCMAPIYYKEAKAALCIFDLTSEKSLQGLEPWIYSIKNNARDECILVLIGNKSDLENREVSQVHAQKYAEKIGAKYFEVSAFTGKGLLNLMIYLAKRLMRWNDCNSTYAAKRLITSNFIEHKASSDTNSSPLEKKLVKRRFSFPLRRLSLNDVALERKVAVR